MIVPSELNTSCGGILRPTMISCRLSVFHDEFTKIEIHLFVKGTYGLWNTRRCTLYT